MLRLISKIVFKIKGWQIKSNFDPSIPKAIIIGAPHTSNWDFVYGVLAIRHERIPVKIIAKHSLFKWPLGSLMRALGCVPIDRSKSQNFVKATTELFESTKQLYIGMSPEGTRSKVRRWKGGFYYLAFEAKVPIYLGYLDYGNKILGMSHPFYPTGDIEADHKKIQKFYEDIIPKNPENWDLEGITNTKI